MVSCSISSLKELQGVASTMLKQHGKFTWGHENCKNEPGVNKTCFGKSFLGHYENKAKV